MISHENYGYIKITSANANDFSYDFYITSVSPISGIKAGGTILTITGKNFSP